MGMTTHGLSSWQADSEWNRLLDTTIGDFLDRHAQELPSQEAIVYSCYPEFGEALNLRWTYQDYRERANAVAKGLRALGCQKGDHIAVRAAEAIDQEGWLHTGDLATMVASGHVTIVGRLKEMVIRGGENLFPAEIEEVLLRHPSIANAQVVGVPDAFFGEELLAVLVTKEGEQLSEQEVRDYCRGQISHQKVPRYVQFVESYPMTESGKVQKFVLREQAIKTLELEEVAKIKTA